MWLKQFVCDILSPQIIQDNFTLVIVTCLVEIDNRLLDVIKIERSLIEY